MNVGVVLIIAIHEISNHENEFDVNSRNIRHSKITRYAVLHCAGDKEMTKYKCKMRAD